MAEVTLHPDSQQFPPGTKLKVFPRPLPETGPPLSGKPPGAETGEFTVAADGHLTVTGLTEDLQYVGWAATPDRYLRFTKESVAGGGGGGGAPTGAAGGDLEGSEYPNPVIAAEKITAGKLAANAVETGKIKAKAITSALLADALKAEVEAGGSPTGAAGGDLEGSTYPNPVVASGKIVAAKLATDSVIEAKIKAEAVTAAKLATDAVTEGKIKDKAVSEAKLTAALVTKFATEREAAEAASSVRLALHADVESNGTTATVKQLTPVNATAEARPIKLPATGVDGDRLAIEKKDETTNVVKVEGSIRGEAAQTLDLKTFRQSIEFTCFANSWWPTGGYVRLAGLDARYALTTDARLSDERTPSALSVTEAKLASEAVTSGKVKKETLTRDRLTVTAQEELKGSGGTPTGAAGGVLAGEYPSPTFAAEGITAAAIKAKAVTAAAIAESAVESTHIKPKAVTASKLAAEAVEAEHIKDAAVTETKLATDAVVAAKIKEGAVTEAKLGAEAVTAAKLKTDAVTEAKIKEAAVTATKIAANAVEATHIKADAVIEAKIKEGAVTASRLAANAVETAKIKAEAVTAEKLSKAVQEALEPKVMERSFAISGEVKNETFPGFYVKLGVGEKKKLIAARYSILTGTAIKVEVRKNGAEISAYKALAAKEAAATTTSTTELEDGDFINIKTSAGEGTPKGLTVTLFLESVN